MKQIKFLLSFSISDFLISTISGIIAITLTAFINWYYAVGLFLISNIFLYLFRYRQEQKLGLYGIKENIENLLNDLEDLIKHPQGRIKNNLPKFIELLSKEKKELSDKLRNENNSHKMIGLILSQIIKKLRTEKPSKEILSWFLHNYFILLYYIQEEFIKPTHQILERENISIDVENAFNDLLSDYETILKKSDELKKKIDNLTKEETSAYYFTPKKIRKVHKMRVG